MLSFKKKHFLSLQSSLIFSNDSQLLIKIFFYINKLYIHHMLHTRKFQKNIIFRYILPYLCYCVQTTDTHLLTANDIKLILQPGDMGGRQNMYTKKNSVLLLYTQLEDEARLSISYLATQSAPLPIFFLAAGFNSSALFSSSNTLIRGTSLVSSVL